EKNDEHAEHAADRTARSDGRDRAARADAPVGQPGDDTASEVGGQVEPRSEALFHVVTGHVQVGHVAEQVEQAADGGLRCCSTTSDTGGERGSYFAAGSVAKRLTSIVPSAATTGASCCTRATHPSVHFGPIW